MARWWGSTSVLNMMVIIIARVKRGKVRMIRANNSKETRASSVVQITDDRSYQLLHTVRGKGLNRDTLSIDYLGKISEEAARRCLSLKRDMLASSSKPYTLILEEVRVVQCEVVE
jgi:hypothetical protein